MRKPAIRGGILATVVIAIALFLTAAATAEPPPPTITFKGLDKNGCKLFDISDKDTVGVRERTGTISAVQVSSGPGGVKSSTSTGSYMTTTAGSLTIFNYEAGTEKVTITVCPADGDEGGVVAFGITAWDGQSEPKISSIGVRERRVKPNSPDGEWSASFGLPKRFVSADCEKAKKSVQTDNVEGVEVTCEDADGFVRIVLKGKLKNPKKPGTAWTTYDPPEEVFLLVADVCVERDGELVCPTKVKANLVITPQDPPKVVTKIVDKSGGTRFHYVIVEGADNISGFGDTLKEALDKWPRKEGSSSTLLEPNAFKDLVDKIEALKTTAEPGEEVVIAYLGHGGGGEETGVPDKDDANEKEDFDNQITIIRDNEKKDTLTDDKLVDVISGFKESVTISVFLGSCFGGSFEEDLKRAKNKDGKPYGSHLSTVGPSGEATTLDLIALEEAVKDDDKNGLPDGDNEGDGMLTTEEFRKFFKKFPKSDIEPPKDEDDRQSKGRGEPAPSTCMAA